MRMRERGREKERLQIFWLKFLLLPLKKDRNEKNRINRVMNN
jgi:hypothetical protein